MTLQCRTELRRIFHVEYSDGHLDGRRGHSTILPSVKRQFDTRHALANRLRDLNQVVQAVASAALLEYIFAANRFLALALRRESNLSHGVGIGRNRVGIEDETECAGTNSLGADTDLQL